jgi:hypothetical protein
MKLIQNLQPYIDYQHVSLHTVPLNGQYIKRNDKGKKHGFSFPSNWQSKYSETRNTLATPIGGLLTGSGSVVAIDCDDSITWQLFKSLDPTNTAFMASIGKLDNGGNLIDGGTIFYLHDKDSLPSFRSTNNDRKLDYYSGTGMVFLTTTENETKSSWYYDDKGELYNDNKHKIVFKTMPDIVKATLELLKQPVQEVEKDLKSVQHKGSGFLAPIIEQLNLQNGVYEPLLTAILTPREYRSAKYIEQKHLHPSDIDGSRYMYFFKIASILASDVTIDKETAYNIIYYLNELMANPKELSILNPMLKHMFSGKQLNPEGVPYWQYDMHWLDRGFFVLDRRNNIVEIFYDDLMNEYYFNDVTMERISTASTRSQAIERAKGLVRGFKVKEFDSHNNVHTITEPNKDYGHIRDTRQFNLFKKSEALQILHDSSKYETRYKEPKEFIAYMEHFIPSEEQRTYLLRLLRQKLMTFEYSPVVPYIIGVQGSGKDLLMTVLANLIGRQYVETGIGGTQFLEKYNSWLRGKYFVQLNELSNTLQTRADKQNAQGVLKEYTGSKFFQVRKMGTDYFQEKQGAMFIMTANASPLEIEDTDRRLYYISTPNTFDFSPQCRASSPLNIYNAIMEQTNDIAYWLATEFEDLSDLDYMRAPDSEGRAGIIFETLPTSTKIAWALKEGEFALLYEWLINTHHIFNSKEDMVSLVDLTSTYEEQSGRTDGEHIMKVSMKHAGFEYLVRDSGIYYKVDGISNHKSNIDNSNEIEVDLPTMRR